MDLGQELAEITGGLDALYRAHLTGEREGLIPVTVADVAARPLRDYDEARDAIRSLAQRVPTAAESSLRANYLGEMADSLLALITTFEDGDISFSDRVRRQIRVDKLTIESAILDGYRATIRGCLEAIGAWSGDLACTAPGF